MAEKSLVVTNMNHILNLFGSFDENIRLIQDDLNVTVITRGADIKITGNQPDVEKAYECLSSLLKIAENGDDITQQQVRYVLSMAGETDHIKNIHKSLLIFFSVFPNKIKMFYKFSSKNFFIPRYATPSSVPHISTSTLCPHTTSKAITAIILDASASFPFTRIVIRLS